MSEEDPGADGIGFAGEISVSDIRLDEIDHWARQAALFVRVYGVADFVTLAQTLLGMDILCAFLESWRFNDCPWLRINEMCWSAIVMSGVLWMKSAPILSYTTYSYRVNAMAYRWYELYFDSLVLISHFRSYLSWLWK